MIQAPAFFQVACPSCGTEFPVDPEKVPPGGVPAICSECQRVFPVEVPEDFVVAPVEEPSEEDQVPTSEALSSAAPELEDLPDSDVDIEVLDAPEPEVQPDAPEREGEAEEEPEPGTPAEQDAEPEASAPADESAEDESEGAADTVPPAEVSAEEDLEAMLEDLTTVTSEALADEDLDEQLAGSALSLAADRFGKRDPGERARRLARVLVSDIIAYFPARYRDSLARGTVKEDFEDEVKKSWKEYVDQVGLEVAESTPHFEDALNEILGKGEKIF